MQGEVSDVWEHINACRSRRALGPDGPDEISQILTRQTGDDWPSKDVFLSARR